MTLRLKNNSFKNFIKKLFSSRERTMYLTTKFYFKGPICNCLEANMAWKIDTRQNVTFFCKTCNVSLVIPAEQWSANFILETPYPGKMPAEKKASKEKRGLPPGVTVILGGKGD